MRIQDFWTGLIALIAVFVKILLPKLMPVLSPDTSVIVGYLEKNEQQQYLFYTRKRNHEMDNTT